MNYALIFAGGTGQRMNTKTLPKQFLELHGKPIIVYTLEVFENHPEIDGIVVVCLEDWIPFLEKKITHYGIDKVLTVVPGGRTGQQSIRNGLHALSNMVGDDVTVLVHDGVRPLLDEDTITDCIESVSEYGNAITVTPAIETVLQESNGRVTNIIERQDCRMAKAPQCFNLGELLSAHASAESDGLHDFIDSASLMRHYGHELHVVEGSQNNIKITTPSDFYIFRAFVDAQESSQIFGF